MPIYPIINEVTGEQKEITMSISEWDEWKKENQEWKRDWSDPTTLPNNCETGEWKDKLSKKYPGWNEVLKSAKKAGASKNNIRD